LFALLVVGRFVDSSAIEKAIIRERLQDKELLRQIGVTAGYGMTDRQIAHIFGFCVQTFQTLANYMPELKEALELGRSSAIAEVSRTAYNMAVGGLAPNMTQFWLRARADWRDVSTVEHREVPQVLVDTEAKAAIERLSSDPETFEILLKLEKKISALNVEAKEVKENGT